MNNDKLISKAQLAEETGLKVSYIDRAMYNYNLPHYKLGRMVRFKLSEVAKWLQQRKKSA